MANTHKLITSTTVSGSSTYNIQFASIPQTYTDLKIIMKAKINGPSANGGLKFNSSTSNYKQMVVNGVGTTVSANYTTGLNSIAYWYFPNNDSSYSNRFGYNEIYIGHYAGTNYKTCRIYSMSPSSSIGEKATTTASWWDATAISQIDIYNYQNSPFNAGSTFQLYGIKRN
jgi:hypothetical protein